MIIWIDAQLSPALAAFVATLAHGDACAVRDLALRNAKDRDIYLAARQANAIIMTKDGDFLSLSQELGSPPQVIWITCGNTSNAVLQSMLRRALQQALKMLAQGESVVEISG